MGLYNLKFEAQNLNDGVRNPNDEVLDLNHAVLNQSGYIFYTNNQVI